jgi:hypothetical protein
MTSCVRGTAALPRRFTGRIVFESAPDDSASLTLNMYTVEADGTHLRALTTSETSMFRFPCTTHLKMRERCCAIWLKTDPLLRKPVRTEK